jgi:hypothetical protein
LREVAGAAWRRGFAIRKVALPASLPSVFPDPKNSTFRA